MLPFIGGHLIFGSAHVNARTLPKVHSKRCS